MSTRDLLECSHLGHLKQQAKNLSETISRFGVSLDC